MDSYEENRRWFLLYVKEIGGLENPLVVEFYTSHLLPQLDDGAKSMEESLRLIKD